MQGLTGGKCYSCKKINHLAAKHCAGHIFINIEATQKHNTRQRANLLVDQTEQFTLSSDEDSELAQGNAISRRINDASPLYRIRLSQVGVLAFPVESTPDTSCTVSLLNLYIAQRNGIKINRTRTVQLYHTAGSCMQVEGMAKIKVCPECAGHPRPHSQQ